MSKTRLVNADREVITAAIIAHKFDPLFEANRKEQHALALEARTVAYGDFLKTMDRAPKGAFGTSSTIKVAVGGKKIGLSFGAMTQHRCFYSQSYNSEPAVSLPETDPFGQRVLANAEAAEALKSERGNLKSSTRALLDNVSSFDALIEAWPEAGKFITAQWRARGTYIANVPMIAIAKLTEALDLPPDDDAQPLGTAEPVAA